MNLYYLLRARLAHTLREPVFLIFIALSVTVSVFAALFAAEKQRPGFEVAVVTEDDGALGGELAAFLFAVEDFNAREMPKEAALRLLSNDRLDALVVILSNFSKSLSSGEFRGTLELMTSPSSQAPATIGEPVLNGAMMLWMEEFSAIRAREFLAGRGEDYTPEDEARQRAEMKALWETGAAFSVKTVELGGAGERGGADSPLHTSIKWYCALVMFFFLHAASWALESDKSGLAKRLCQTENSKWKMAVGSCLPAFLAGFAGFLAAGGLTAALTGGGFGALSAAAAPVALYLAALTGMTVFVASCLKSPLALMFIAPVLTFLSAVMSGLLAELPKWAHVLALLSHALPGKWLALSLAQPLKAMPGAAACCAAWAAAGLALSSRSKRPGKRRQSP